MQILDSHIADIDAYLVALQLPATAPKHSATAAHHHQPASRCLANSLGWPAASVCLSQHAPSCAGRLALAAAAEMDSWQPAEERVLRILKHGADASDGIGVRSSASQQLR
jgi:hypothetical protein